MTNTTLKQLKTPTKPYQGLAWTGTVVLIIAASLASFYPTVDMVFGLPGQLHHYGFTIANGIWVAIGILWKEKSLLVLNAGLTIIYLLGLFKDSLIG
jgi:hypothetical protein